MTEDKIRATFKEYVTRSSCIKYSHNKFYDLAVGTLVKIRKTKNYNSHYRIIGPNDLIFKCVNYTKNGWNHIIADPNYKKFRKSYWYHDQNKKHLMYIDKIIGQPITIGKIIGLLPMNTRTEIVNFTYKIKIKQNRFSSSATEIECFKKEKNRKSLCKLLEGFYVYGASNKVAVFKDKNNEPICCWQLSRYGLEQHDCDQPLDTIKKLYNLLITI